MFSDIQILHTLSHPSASETSSYHVKCQAVLTFSTSPHVCVCYVCRGQKVQEMILPMQARATEVGRCSDFFLTSPGTDEMIHDSFKKVT